MDCQEVDQTKALFSPPSDDVYQVQIECGGKIAFVGTQYGTAIGLHAQRSEQQLHLNYPV